MPLPKLDRTPDSQRSRTMRAVKSANTTPELVVRRIVHGLGRRYRLHHKGLPGKPDLVFAKDRRALFVHGCFWHGHDCKRGARTPKTNQAYWRAKIARNIARDAAVRQTLEDDGWRTFVVWECETRDRAALKDRLADFLQVTPADRKDCP
jgi:DNA mismatch endonuclease (patch repair protein)